MEELTKDQINMLKSAFDAFDHDKVGYISVDMVGNILDMLGQNIEDEQLQEIIDGFDTEKTGHFTFENFKSLAARFLIEEEDIETIRAELREAFRLYDKEGNGYITTDVLREILKELDNNVSASDLDEMIDEIDADGSGTVDFEEFMQVMTG